ncbi:HNH endonuclease [Candidatus Parcubacteria bacterium]|uniref:HNH nuclease domain-containing protein n=1 Tax=Candidatus Uhrbacteria bacterium CG_4_9_14_3_um_filter_41_35 TaxID=1975034 RepID=A0A2M7XEH3_9BACT|nr:HNH endonuclease [Candidatus Parcubacteria bacterium]PIQ67515.1 MAG: hypothetical protein COV92_02535 [Candidatus Uhrbacteria bacterium CG11_big_fil_rev_8_21_14_0_20_41_9]PIZ54165.1 MAG: hypothetical protein COY25_02415 [Candidatus Uhrbacteria bacterium CG_4_10_14_0_2_um_filter_41_7]PJA46245.1 MAG: hypothetical protein CO173_03260 [Candidatus Uhrbacteria bacterium CG_4_9_14_3_um_filter_41_35]
MNQFEYSLPKNRPVSSDDLLNDLRSVSESINSQKITQKEYVKLGKFDVSTFVNRFGSWNEAVNKCGFKSGNIVNYSDENLFENILNIWQQKGKQPVRRDLNTSPSKISQSPYNRRFSSWAVAMKSFVEYMNNKGVVNVAYTEISEKQVKQGRDPNLRLRFQVLKRDNFSCVKCGNSPAKNQEVILHIDHILPWSKGGETEIQNLQTLCDRCNLGKSNVE